MSIERTFQVCAFDGNGLQVLGNMDGQGFFKCKIPYRCTWFKRLATLKTLNNRIQEYIVYDVTANTYEKGNEIARIANMNHPNWY